LLPFSEEQDCEISISTLFFAFLYKSAIGFQYRFHKYRFSNVKASLDSTRRFHKSAFDL